MVATRNHEYLGVKPLNSKTQGVRGGNGGWTGP